MDKEDLQRSLGTPWTTQQKVGQKTNQNPQIWELNKVQFRYID